MVAHALAGSAAARHRAVALAAAIVMLLAGACDKMPLVAPSGTALTLVATTNVLPVNGGTDITAVLIEGGQAGGEGGEVIAGVGTPVHNGTLVTFLTTLGRIEPVEARTTAGRATVRLIADGRSGIAKITAFSGAATNTLDVNIGAAGASRVVVTANPQSLPATGGATTITARVEDAQGNGLLGVPVSFSTTKGTLASTNVLSNEQGFASTILTTSEAADVTASTGGATAALSGTVAISLRPQTTISIRLTSGSPMIGVQSTFEVTPGTATIIRSAVVDFDDGTGTWPLGEISGPTTIQHLFGEFGVRNVKVTATDAQGSVVSTQSAVVVAPLAVSLTVSPAPKVGDNTVFTAVLPANAVIVRYEWNFGDGNTRNTETPQTFHQYQSTGQRIATVRVVPFVGPAATALAPVDVR
jgi:hypothetical protein